MHSPGLVEPTVNFFFIFKYLSLLTGVAQEAQKVLLWLDTEK